MKRRKKTESKKGEKRRNPFLNPSKIDEIVPYADELDYIKDYDGDYGLDNVRFRFEFEMSPDGVHIVRPVSEVHPDEINATHELIIREAKLLAREFGFTEEQLKVPSLFREFVRVTTLWYIVTKYPLAHLRKLVRDGYFKHPEEVIDFIITVDDFADAEEVVSQLYVPYQEKGYARIPGENTGEDAEDMFHEDEENEEQADFFEYTDELALIAVEYDRNREYEILERISEINRLLRETRDPEEKEKLLEEKKALTAEIRRMREEFLMEHNLTYERFVMLRRERQIMKNWGWVKYPMYGEDDEEHDKWRKIEDILLEKIERLNILINTLRTEGENHEDDEEEAGEKYSLSELIEKRKKFLSSVERIRYRRMTPEERKIHEIHRLIDRIYCLGRDRNRLAYKLSNEVKARIKKIRSHAMRKVLYLLLDQTWKKRNERFEKLFGKKVNLADCQLTLFKQEK